MKRIIALILLLASSLAAEPSSPSVTVEFTVVGWGEEITGLSYRQGGRLKKLETVPLFRRSEKAIYSGPVTLDFYKMQSASGSDSKAAKEEDKVASVSIPTDAKRVLILLAPRRGAENRYDAFAIPDNPGAIPGGKALIMNLSPQNVAIRCNKSASLTLAPKQSNIAAAGRSSILQLEIALNQNGRWKKITNSYVPLPEAYETMIFLLQSDSEYFQNIDGKITSDLQMVTLIEPVNPQS